MSLYIGIDFGTSTNYITRWDEKKKKAVGISGIARSGYGGSNFFENVIYYDSLTNVVIGGIAFDRGIVEPENVVESIKRHIEDDNWTTTIPAIGKTLNSQEIATDIFMEVKKRVEEIHGGTPIDGVVISVPFAFQNKERQKIKHAAEDAGLNVMGLIEEPVAAAICFGLFDDAIKDDKRERILIFDLGGGTFDVTIFELIKKSNDTIRVEVLNTDGDKNLGGKDIDEMLVKKFEDHVGYKLIDIANRKQQRKDHLVLLKEAKKIKEVLSESEDGDAFCSGLDGEKILEIDLTQEQFEEWIKKNGFLGKIKQVLESSLFEVELEPSDIDKIVLVGGSSNIPSIQRLIEEFFGKKAESIKNPGELVGEGAGIYCGSLIDKTLDYEIITKVSHSIGIKLGDSKFKPLIKRNSKYETFSATEYFNVNAKTDRDTKIEIYQGNSTDVSRCSYVGSIKINGSELLDAKVGIQLGTDKNGIIKYKLYKIDGTFYIGGEL